MNWPKYQGCRHVLRSPLITHGFPGTFNMSFTEHHWMKEFGSYTDWDHDYAISTVQSCIRLNDFELLLKENAWRYLGVFEMGDLSGEIVLRHKPDYAEILTWQVSELVQFLAELGIPASRIHASYALGGNVTKITRGKYRFAFEVPEDTYTRNAFLEAGIPATNLIPDMTRDTFLSLYIHRPTPWGYRNEIYINLGTAENPRLLDIATLEYLMWNPEFQEGPKSSKQITGLTEIKNGYFGIAFGVERLCMAVNGLPRIHDVDYLKQFYNAAEKMINRDLVKSDYFVGESLRALHRIYTDRDFHPESAVTNDESGRKSMGLKRRKKTAMLKRNIPLRLTDDDMRELLQAHTESQPWHESLAAGIDITIAEIEDYRNSQAGNLIPSQ